MALESIHIKILKGFIDELILNSGVIKIDNPERVVEKVKIDYLVKLAFRFYSKLYSSEKYASHLKDTIEHLNDDYYNKQPIFQSFLHQLQTENEETPIQCLNCNALISIKDLKNQGDSMPLCKDCQDTIGLEMEIWEKVFGDK
jgi:hypothetical protein